MKFRKLKWLFACGKPWYKKWWVWILVGSFLFVLFYIPFSINNSYMKGYLFNIAPNTSFSANDMLLFYGSILSFIGTLALGLLALWQNKKVHDINTKLLDLDKQREDEKLFELYFSFLDQSAKIFEDPLYIIGDIEEQRSSVEIFNAIQSCKIKALSIKRRLLFLDRINSDNEFLEYAIRKIDEIKKIAIENKSDDNLVIQHEILEFMKDYGDEFNRKSLQFINQIYESIFKNRV